MRQESTAGNFFNNGVVIADGMFEPIPPSIVSTEDLEMLKYFVTDELLIYIRAGLVPEVSLDLY